MTSKPLVSIIIPNYNGKKFLNRCFKSLFQMNYPKSKYEVILVDNCSSDTSIAFTLANYPEVVVVESEINLGFAQGCNLGAANAQGKYIALLNNDTIVDKNWLSNLVDCIESDKNIAAVNSKVLIYYPFVEVTINSDLFLRSEFTGTINFQQVGVLVENVMLDNSNLRPLVRYRSGFYEKEKGLIPARWTKGDASILIPCDPLSEYNSFSLTIRSEKNSTTLHTKILIKVGDKEFVNDDLKSYEVKQFNINMKTSEIQENFLYEIQNCGVAVFKSGYGRDRGAVVKDAVQFNEVDNKFYQTRTDILSFSGASVLIKKDIFDRLEGFDSSYFMYYEDVDLSLRMKRLNYKIVCEPRSKVRHIHAGSSEEWSSFFVYNVEKNHLATLIKHFPLQVCAQQIMRYLLIFFISILRMGKWRVKEHWELYDFWRERVECRKKVISWVWVNLFSLLNKRQKINRQSEISIEKLYQQLY